MAENYTFTDLLRNAEPGCARACFATNGRAIYLHNVCFRRFDINLTTARRRRRRRLARAKPIKVALDLSAAERHLERHPRAC